MGYDGLGGDDVMRVLADVRRAYDVDPDCISPHRSIHGRGGDSGQIGLRHPELFAAIAPVRGVTDVRKWMTADERDFYDVDAALDVLLPLALATNAAHMQVFIFHGGSDTVVPVTDSRRMVDRYRALGWLNKNVHYTEYPGSATRPGTTPTRTPSCYGSWRPSSATLRRRRCLRLRLPPAKRYRDCSARACPANTPHLYVYGTNGPPAAVAAARELALQLADWGPMVSAKFAVKADREVTAAERARFNLVVVGAVPLNSFAAGLPVREVAAPGAPLAIAPFVPSWPTPRRRAAMPWCSGPSRRGASPSCPIRPAESGRRAPEPNKPFVLLPTN